MPTRRIKDYERVKLRLCDGYLGYWLLLRRLRCVRKHGSPGAADMIQFIGRSISVILFDFS